MHTHTCLYKYVEIIYVHDQPVSHTHTQNAAKKLRPLMGSRLPHHPAGGQGEPEVKSVFGVHLGVLPEKLKSDHKKFHILNGDVSLKR